MREREREREKDVWWIAWTLRPAFICWSLNCRWSGWCQKEGDTAPPFFDFPTWVCFFEFHHGNAHLRFWMTRLEYNWPLVMDKHGGRKGGFIVQRQPTCFLPSSPGFDTRCSQKNFRRKIIDAAGLIYGPDKRKVDSGLKILIKPI